jgi:ABC-type nitrate/sulfonate/bicarbonate transport system permease component
VSVNFRDVFQQVLRRNVDQNPAGKNKIELLAAELTGADAGLGWRIFWYQEFFAMDKVMAVILSIGVLGYALDLVLRRVQSELTRWSADTRMEAA